MSIAKEEVYYDQFDREVHRFTDEFGEVTEIVGTNAGDYIFVGEQWCPYCAVQMEEIDDAFRCPNCGHEISYSEAMEDGFPSYISVIDYQNGHDYR